MGDSLSYAWREIRRRKSRTMANSSGYLLAVIIMIVLVTAIQMARDTASSVLTDIGAHTIGFIPRCAADGCPAGALDPSHEGFVVNGAPSDLISPAMVEMINQSPYVKEASPYMMFRVRATDGTGGWILGGFDPSKPASFSATVVAPSQVVEGRFITPEDNGVVMIEEAFALNRNLKVDDTMELAGLKFKVAGIVNPPLRPGKANIYMPIWDARKLINTRVADPVKEAVNAVLVESKSADVHNKALIAIKGILGDKGLMSSYGCSGPGAKALGIHQETAWLLTLVVGLCMIALAMKSQYSTVLERRHDIGILKTIGWTNKNVIRQILSESLLQSLFGGVAGCVAAVSILLMLPPEWIIGTKTAGVITIRFAVVLGGFGIALLGGLIAGIVPAWVAARMRPADVLRRL